MRWLFIRVIGASRSKQLGGLQLLHLEQAASRRECREARQGGSAPLPRATEPIQLDPQIRLICPVGGVILFSAAQMHSSVPNISGVTRFSIDFRTVHLDDVIERKARRTSTRPAPAQSCAISCAAPILARLPEDIVALYDDGTAVDGELIYMPKSA